MVSTFTPNIQLEEPARGDDVGTWDTPVNNNMTLVDLVAGGITSINMSAGSVVLAAAQYKSKTITLTSTLAGNATLTFPTSFIKSYEIQNLCTGNFTITLLTTAAGGQAICAPPGEIIDCINDGSNVKYKNLGRVGSYMDLCVATVPAWISGCTVPPYLNCDGTTFSSATYPILATILGSTTLPDSRGRVRSALDAGTGRLSSGFFADTPGAAGGSALMQQHSHQIDYSLSGGSGNLTFAASLPYIVAQSSADLGAAKLGVTEQTGSGTSQNIQPTYRGGLTLIRSA